MIINMNGGGGGSSELNFKVVFSADAPSAAKDNTIWVKTSTASGTWSMLDSADLSSITTNGHVVISYESSNSPNGTFNALKKNELYVKLTKCYQRASSKWESLDAYVYKGSSWKQFSKVFKATITVTYPAGSTCTATNGSIKLTASNTSGSFTFSIPSTGTWTIACTNGTENASTSVSITADGQSKSVTLVYNQIPKFTYTGDYEITNDAGEVISVSKDNWNIRLLTSGTFKLTEASANVDVFVVGGGGGGIAIGQGGSQKNNNTPYYFRGSGGGGGGYTSTATGITMSASTVYTATIGAGGATGTSSTAGDGGVSSIVIGSTTYSANGGIKGAAANGGAGGSGGGGGGMSANGGAGGTDGSSGTDGEKSGSAYTSGGTGGTGQGTTTRAFGDANGVLYATGGGGGGGYVAGSGRNWTQGAGGGDTSNTGNGGKGGGAKEAGGAATAGASGVVIIRNHRTA